MQALESREKRGFRRDELNERTRAGEFGSPSYENTARPTVTLSDGAFTNAKLPKGGWLKNPFDDLRFTGRNDPQNPIKFLRRFEKIARYEEIGDKEQLYYFGKCLRGTAANWFDVRDPNTICETKEAFTEYYWDEEPQNRFREEIYNGSYDANTSMSEYALNLTKQTKFLTPPMSDSETIRCIKRHFGASVAREIRPSTVKTIENFVTILDEIDYEQKRDRKIKARSEDSGSKSGFAKGKNAAGNKYPSKDINAGANKQTTPYGKYGSNYAKQSKTDYAERDNTGKILNNATINDTSCNKDGNADDKKFASVN
ncbi:ap2 erf domain-containing protein [Lasius niger]|uniref:Ap2 erf domain-containing protein n=1 Tax=Lasius niger TaxID=67767 RepID=A0A0J7K6H0_LASNI|nr:ap2 erf domain-containing protein [Lasius niger]